MLSPKPGPKANRKFTSIFIVNDLTRKSETDFDMIDTFSENVIDTFSENVIETCSHYLHISLYYLKYFIAE